MYYGLIMNKVKTFKSHIKNNRNQLVNSGLNKWTVNSWIYQDRIPTLENAKKVAAILNIPLIEIPYFHKEKVI